MQNNLPIWKCLCLVICTWEKKEQLKVIKLEESED